jgi:hypothetical protein
MATWGKSAVTNSWRDLPKDRRPTAEEFIRYPGMTGWFNPGLLFKLLWRVIISDLFGQYADRRLLEAALDNVPKSEIQNRDDLSQKLEKDSSGAVWIDFVADLGDGFDATYAIAYLLAQQSLTVGGQTLPRGGALFMGGDEVYPTSGRDDYNVKMRAPYQFAFPNQRKVGKHPSVFAIPGNHDWYDGLVNFLAFFARAKATPIGNWRTQQKRSYFAAKLTDQCWLWAIDIALVEDMDQPQADYFVTVAKEMQQGANVILCSAEPGWYTTDSMSYRTLSYAAWIAENAGKALHIPLVLSGDTHHYARYSSQHNTEFVTSGGGGAFLHGTHQLPSSITLDWLTHSKDQLALKKCHPDFATSRRLLWGDFAFPFLNFGFSATLGAIYTIVGYTLSLVPRVDLGVLLFLGFAAGFVGYSAYQEKRNLKTVVALAALHSAVHFLVLLGITYSLSRLDAQFWSLRINGPWWAWLIELGVPTVLLGGLTAGLIFGANLFFTCRFADMNHNDAFSAMRLNSFRHFLRIKILGDQITVYPIGIDRVPKRDEWRDNPANAQDPTAPYFVPPNDFKIKLIEEPIVVSGHETPTTTFVKNPSQLSQ